MYLKTFFITLSSVVLFATFGYADCPHGDALWDRQEYQTAERYYLECAKENDSDALYKLGLIYKNGYIEQQKDVIKGLAFLRFSAENGYAPAQRELGESLLELEQTESGRKIISEYQGKIQPTSKGAGILARAKRTDLSPYAWILLAAEKEENKWYYPSKTISDEKAVQIIQESRMGKDARTKAVTEAGAWKMNKLRSSAKEILTLDEYRTFERAVFSEQANPADRASAMGFLKQKIEMRKK
ncbi:MAG: sel1 repeat family protein [Alphaproteobacteria bacterium]|nr:sel1 repeat family protein [Alphaproteobacteria bacterium]